MLIAIPMKVLHSTRSFLLTAVTKPLKVNQKLNSGPAKQNLIILKKTSPCEAQIKGVFSKSYCCYGNLVWHENVNNVLSVIGQFFIA